MGSTLIIFLLQNKRAFCSAVMFLWNPFHLYSLFQKNIYIVWVYSGNYGRWKSTHFAIFLYLRLASEETQRKNLSSFFQSILKILDFSYLLMIFFYWIYPQLDHWSLTNIGYSSLKILIAPPRRHIVYLYTLVSISVYLHAYISGEKDRCGGDGLVVGFMVLNIAFIPVGSTWLTDLIIQQ